MRWMLCLVLLTGEAIAAPAPSRPKATPKKAVARPAAPAMVGSWRMAWGHGQGDVVLTLDRPGGAEGGYWCLWSGQQWVGGWRLEGRRLIVTEGRVPDRPDGVPETPISWTVDLDATGRAGVLRHAGEDGTFRLSEALPPPMPAAGD